MAIGLQTSFASPSVACVRLFTICHGEQILVIVDVVGGTALSAPASRTSQWLAAPVSTCPNRVAADGTMVSAKD
jgi:hypothetical protein